MNAWSQELERPSEAFFRAFAARVTEPDGVGGAVWDAVLFLVPRVDWPGYLPQVPHGLLGLAAVWDLRSHLQERSFLRLVATQIRAFAAESRASGPGSLQMVKGSGHWSNIELALRDHRPAIAWGELAALETPTTQDFQHLLPFAAPDMANIGHKAVAIGAMERLWGALGRSPEMGRVLLAWAGWLTATEPDDRFWRVRMARRLEGGNLRVPIRAVVHDDVWHREFAREVCDFGLVALLDAIVARLKAGAGSGDLLAGLVLAAAEKMMDARRDLEGKTAWNLVYLSIVAGHLATLDQPEVWGQAAALVNFFPSDAPEDRRQARRAEHAEALLDAILDGEPELAMGLAECPEGAAEPVFSILAEATSRNDPGNNHSSQVLAVAAAARLAPLLPEYVVKAMRIALAKSLANSQGSDDLGRMADLALVRF